MLITKSEITYTSFTKPTYTDAGSEESDSVTPIQNISIKCKSCGHELNIDRTWAIERFELDPYSSVDDIHSHLQRYVGRMKCSKCGSKSPSVLMEIRAPKVLDQLEDHEKRYIDEGLAGSREDHKKMRSRQWARTKRPKF